MRIRRDRDLEKERNGEKRQRDGKDRDRDRRSLRDKFHESEERYDVEKCRGNERDRRERGTEKERERERDRKRRRVREREKRRDVESDDDDDRERDRKRRRKDDKEYYMQRNRDDGVRSHMKKSDEGGLVKEETKPMCEEEELEDEERKLDEELEKRRRRVQEWQELRRKEEEEKREKCGEGHVDEPKTKKAWNLEVEYDEDEEEEEVSPQSGNEAGAAMDIDAESDPLDAFMNSMVVPEVEKLQNAVEKNSDKKDSNKSLGRILPEDYDLDYGYVENGDDPSEDKDDDAKRKKKTKADKLTPVDHSKIDYKPFRKNFYIEVKEISTMTPEDVGAYRKQLELKIYGKDVLKPLKTWNQTGLTNKILEIIKKLNYEKPLPIQAQAVPIVMSGRDCIGVGKTGSGKTLAFVLPMLRHIRDQLPVISADGPVGLVMAPTRELVQQIHSVIKKFAKLLGLRCVPVYGGSGMAQQINELKRGAEIVVCTPGRMIDILCTSAGKITNLRRVTYLVMDEADRMFDQGFEPQITRIVQNIRPDRQTVLFSATFPRQVEVLARKVLNNPVHIEVGGRSVVNKDITQFVEVRPENERFMRLLEILGEWYERGKVLIFAKEHDACDALLRDLLTHGYPCLSLHGAKDQTDRESTISDFKSNVCNLLIATSLAARGLDVKGLELVINYDSPDHYEDYVHRVGRTGRAGQKGCAITFISKEDAQYAPDLVKALELSEQVVPDDLKSLADNFKARVNQGLEKVYWTGYGGSGYKFNEEEDEMRKAAKKAQATEYGFEDDMSDSVNEDEDGDEGIRKAGSDVSQQAALAESQKAAISAATKCSIASMQTPLSGIVAKIQADAKPKHYEAELEINDFPQNVRWKVTRNETQGPISEFSGAAIATRGQYFPPGKLPGPGKRNLDLFIEGLTEHSVKSCKAQLKCVLEDFTSQASSLPGGMQQGRYQVV